MSDMRQELVAAAVKGSHTTEVMHLDDYYVSKFKFKTLEDLETFEKVWAEVMVGPVQKPVEGTTVGEEHLAEKPVVVTVRLPQEAADYIHNLSRMSGYDDDTVASVMFAMASMRWKEQGYPQEGSVKPNADESEAEVAAEAMYPDATGWAGPGHAKLGDPCPVCKPRVSQSAGESYQPKLVATRPQHPAAAYTTLHCEVCGAGSYGLHYFVESAPVSEEDTQLYVLRAFDTSKQVPTITYFARDDDGRMKYLKSRDGWGATSFVGKINAIAAARALAAPPGTYWRLEELAQASEE